MLCKEGVEAFLAVASACTDDAAVSGAETERVDAEKLNADGCMQKLAGFIEEAQELDELSSNNIYFGTKLSDLQVKIDPIYNVLSVNSPEGHAAYAPAYQ